MLLDLFNWKNDVTECPKPLFGWDLLTKLNIKISSVTGHMDIKDASV